jgi:hypothetical protein
LSVAEGRYDDMIELGCPPAVRAREVKVVERLVGSGIKAGQGRGHRPLSEPPLETGGTEKFRKKQQNEKAEKPRPVREEWLENLSEVDL